MPPGRSALRGRRAAMLPFPRPGAPRRLRGQGRAPHRMQSGSLVRKAFPFQVLLEHSRFSSTISSLLLPLMVLPRADQTRESIDDTASAATAMHWQAFEAGNKLAAPGRHEPQRAPTATRAVLESADGSPVDRSRRRADAPPRLALDKAGLLMEASAERGGHREHLGSSWPRWRIDARAAVPTPGSPLRRGARVETATPAIPSSNPRRVSRKAALRAGSRARFRSRPFAARS